MLQRSMCPQKMKTKIKSTKKMMKNSIQNSTKLLNKLPEKPGTNRETVQFKILRRINVDGVC